MNMSGNYHLMDAIVAAAMDVLLHNPPQDKARAAAREVCYSINLICLEHELKKTEVLQVVLMELVSAITEAKVGKDTTAALNYWNSLRGEGGETTCH